MAKKIWSSFSTGATTTFDPTQDIFVFDATTPGGATEISAAEITFVQNGANLEMTYLGGKTVTLLNTTLEQLTSSTATALGNIRFNDESKLLIGDNTTGTANDNLANTLTGGIGNDQLLGLGGNDNLSGGAGNDLLDGGIGSDIMAGGTGNDTYVVDSSSDSITEALSAGTDEVQSSAASYTLGTNVEKLTLTGTAAIGTGNTLANTITGNSGNNTLSGGTDALVDTLVGGAGNDIYVVSTGDIVTEGVGEGTDTVQSSVSYDLSAAANVENLTLTGTATTGTGNGSDNFITGNASVNTLIGGAGNDTYVVSTGDTVTELADEGTDEIQSSVTYSLAATGTANVENLTLTGASAINGTGNTGTNIIKGNIAANTLDGGAGADTLIGGTGNDTYVVDNAGDVVTEDLSAGTDLVKASVTHSLDDNVENLTLTGTSAIGGTGNGLDNTITGNSAINTLNGGLGNDLLDGGAGADALAGGGGNDIYVVDNTGDVVTEALSAGTDLVKASVTYSLAAATGTANVENLTLTGALAINGTGNSLDNTITGNTANNTLNGGVGADTLTGGTGNDTYVVDNAGDVVTELASQGTDEIQASVTYSLAAATGTANVENLTLTGTADSGTGNALANTITGNAAVVSTLTGGAGNDTYVVSNASTIVEVSTEGTDLVKASVSYTLGATDIENLTLIGTSNIDGTGNTLANTITGNTGNNTLNGGNDALADTLIGGTGNDTYVVSTGDIVNEVTGGGGTDLVQASIDYTLGTNVENLELTGTATNGTGNTLANKITGNSANNTLDGGIGADTLIGGGGNDIYKVDNIGDVASDSATGVTGGGTDDEVQASVSYALGATSGIENLTLKGTSNINGTGNDLNNVITGNTGNNTLNGGAGADTLIGGLGSDIYVVGTGDSVTELADEGTDEIQSSVTYNLTTAANVEKLTLTGTAFINGTGNGLDNTITGNIGNNTLNGGIGADTLKGLAGNDIYVVDDAGDVVTELALQGTDLVQASVTYTLGANVENLTLTGASIIGGTGNGSDNIITGNGAANSLDGGAGNDTLKGGIGADTLTGGAGNDILWLGTTAGESDTVEFEANAGTNKLDTVNNFVLGVGGDKLDFSQFSAFTGLVPVIDDTSTGETLVATGNVLQVNETGTALTATTIKALFNTDIITGKPFEAVQAGEKFVLISASSTTDARVWYLDTTSDGLSSDLSVNDIVQVATLVGVSDLDVTPFLAANIV